MSPGWSVDAWCESKCLGITTVESLTLLSGGSGQVVGWQVIAAQHPERLREKGECEGQRSINMLATEGEFDEAGRDKGTVWSASVAGSRRDRGRRRGATISILLASRGGIRRMGYTYLVTPGQCAAIVLLPAKPGVANLAFMIG